jgi:hypothetical protein
MKICLALLIFSLNVYSFETHFNPDEVKLVVGVNSEKSFEIQMESPSKLLIDLNHKPQNDDELLKWKSAQLLWFKNYKKLFSVKGADCTSTESEIVLEVDTDLGVGAILGKLDYLCTSSIVGKKLTIALKETYKTIDQVEVTILPLKSKASRVYLKKSIDSILLN